MKRDRAFVRSVPIVPSAMWLLGEHRPSKTVRSRKPRGMRDGGDAAEDQSATHRHYSRLDSANLHHPLPFLNVEDDFIPVSRPPSRSMDDGMGSDPGARSFPGEGLPSIGVDPIDLICNQSFRDAHVVPSVGQGLEP